jgi:hypothetical protein
MLLNKLTKALGVFSAVVGPAIHAATPLALDDFKAGDYSVSLTTASSQDVHFAPLAPGSPVGPARETVFVIGPNPYGQLSTLDIGKGICILDGGFGVVPGVQIYYGYANAATPAPLGLDLSGYSAFRLNFAGISTEVDL